MKIKDGMVKCPICKKLFLYNPQSIYKLNKGRKAERRTIVHTLVGEKQVEISNRKEIYYAGSKTVWQINDARYTTEAH